MARAFRGMRMICAVMLFFTSSAAYAQTIADDGAQPADIQGRATDAVGPHKLSRDGEENRREELPLPPPVPRSVVKPATLADSYAEFIQSLDQFPNGDRWKQYLALPDELLDLPGGARVDGAADQTALREPWLRYDLVARDPRYEVIAALPEFQRTYTALAAQVGVQARPPRGRGVNVGGPDGVQFGGGAGARFGGPRGVQFGGGQGAKFGGPDGVQFGGGQGVRIGPLQIGR